MTELKIFYDELPVGHATTDDAQRLSFTYAPTWLDHSDAFPISLSLPLRVESWPASRAHSFFANLLPEGPSRQALCRRLGISVENDVALLEAIGDDTAGALRIVADRAPDTAATGTAATDTASQSVPLPDTDLAKWSRGDPAILADPALPPRLSLAGAQHKIGVITTDEGYAIAPPGNPSTFLLKFDAHNFPHLAANEFLTTRFAAALGLDVVDLRLDDRTPQPFLVIRRYDRITYPPGSDGILRLHQEDFCQALGLPPTRKYQTEGGPPLSQIATVLRNYSAAPAADLLRLARWAIFCAISGNADGHAKNISLLYSSQGLRLTPFYDLVCTRAFDDLDPSLAIAIGGTRNPDLLRSEHFQRLATALGIHPRQIEAEANRLIEEAPRALSQAIVELKEAIGYSPAAERVKYAVEKRLRAISNNLKQDR